MKVLLINSVCGIGSTGRIVTEIADFLKMNQHECRIAFGRGEAPEQYRDISYKIASDLDNKIQGLETRLFDTHGFGNKKITKAFLKWIDSYNPDLIHLHNIHGYYINVEMLFAYLKKCGKPVVWTLHDCWTMTGHCAHFSAVGCNQWKTMCKDCCQLKSYPSTLFWGNVKNNYTRKRASFTGVPNMTIVTPSYWLKSVAEESFLGEYNIVPIYNGLDLNLFRPTESSFREKYHLEDKKIVLGASHVWSPKKGLQDFIELSKILDPSYQIVLVGLDPKQMNEIPSGVLGIERTATLQELIEIYSAADVFVNPSIEETMGLTTAEALACGTPVITYNKTAVPEVPDETCGIVVEPSPAEIKKALEKLNVSTEACLKRAEFFEKNKQYQKYLDVYLSALN